MKNNKGAILIAILASAAIGAGLGILYAPNKGSKTRKKIKDGVTDTTHDVSDWLKHAKDDLVKTANENKEAFDKKIEHTVSSMSHKAEDIISDLEDKLKTIKKKNAQLQS